MKREANGIVAAGHCNQIVRYLQSVSFEISFEAVVTYRLIYPTGKTQRKVSFPSAFFPVN